MLVILLLTSLALLCGDGRDLETVGGIREFAENLYQSIESLQFVLRLID